MIPLRTLSILLAFVSCISAAPNTDAPPDVSQALVMFKGPKPKASKPKATELTATRKASTVKPDELTTHCLGELEHV